MPDPNRVNQRYSDLLRTAERVISRLFDAKEIRAIDELSVDITRLREMVAEYFDQIDQFKIRNGYKPGALVNASKIAAYTALVIMAHRPIVCSNGRADTIAAMLANEIFAWRAVINILQLDYRRLNTAIESDMIYCFHVGLFGRDKLPPPDKVVDTWFVGLMTMLETNYSVKYTTICQRCVLWIRRVYVWRR